METVNASRTRREAAVLVFVVFLLGLLVGGVGNHFWGRSVWGSRQERPVRTGPPPRAKMIDDFTRELQLTPDQQQQLGTIIDQAREQWGAEHEAIHRQEEATRQQTRARIRAILTPEQVPKFDAFMQRIDEQHKKDQAQAQH
jgi:Spy/CpxP family protein refolding chaperone